MYKNKKLKNNSTTNKEYNVGAGKYYWDWTVIISRKEFKNWKLYRKNQYKDKVND